jgi:hypothetical protein
MLESGSCIVATLSLILYAIIVDLVIIRPAIFTTRWNFSWIWARRCRLIFPATKWDTISLPTALCWLHFGKFICAQWLRCLATYLRRRLNLLDWWGSTFIGSIIAWHRLVIFTWHLLQIGALGCLRWISRSSWRLVTELCAVVIATRVVLVAVHAYDVANWVWILDGHTSYLLALRRLRKLGKAALDKALLALTSLHLLKI